MRWSPLRVTLVVLAAVGSWGCGGEDGGPTGSGAAASTVSVTGTVKDRITGEPVDGVAITFTGAATRRTLRVAVQGGSYRAPGLPPDNYAVTIEGTSIVPHKTEVASVRTDETLSFSVLRWGSRRFGAVYDETLHRALHQMARGGRPLSSGTIMKAEKLREIYVVEGTVPDPDLQRVLQVVGDLSQDDIPAMWCETAPPRITVGPCSSSGTSCLAEGRLVILPTLRGAPEGASASTLGVLTLGLYRPVDNRLQTPQELRGIVAHELFHAAGYFHLCGGDVRDNPFGFSRANCPYPDSLMANLGDLRQKASPQDRLIACVVSHPDTHEGNRYPDTNPMY